MKFRSLMGIILVIGGIFGMAKVILGESTQFILCTNSRDTAIEYGVFSIKNNKPQLLFSSVIENDNVKNFTQAISDIIEHIKNDQGIIINYACFTAPGVPSANQDYLTHWRLPYNIDVKEIIKNTELKIAVVVNNFLAMSYGIDFIDKKDIVPFYEVPAQEYGRRAIIGAGSGLGSVVMIWDEFKQRYMSLPAEAGTGNFPAFTQFEFDLIEKMKQERNVSTMHWAFFVAIPGIEYTYKILKKMNYYEDSLKSSNIDGLTILSHAQDDALCKATAELFFKFYARFTYNFIWTTLPFGGIYFVGETATDFPELLSEIFLPEFFNCVESKQFVLKRIPLYVIHEDINMRLYGAVQYFLLEKIS